jgi:WASH complex subunit strumpellin
MCGIKFFGLLSKSLGASGMHGLDRLLGFKIVNEFQSFLKLYSKKIMSERPILERTRDELSSQMSGDNAASTGSTGLTTLYTTLAKKLEGILPTVLRILCRVGQYQLIRAQIAHLLQFRCQHDASLLYDAVSALNLGVLQDIESHYIKPKLSPDDDGYDYPRSDNPFLTEVSQILQTCGKDDAFRKVYMTTQPIEGLPVLLLALIASSLPNVYYDSDFGTLCRTHTNLPIDGFPLVAGVTCLLRQFHPSATKEFLGYLGRFAQNSLGQTFRAGRNDPPQLGVAVLVFMEQFCQLSSLDRSVCYAFVPPYIFDSIKQQYAS